MGAALRTALLDPARLDELLRLRLLDTPPEEPFDRLTRLAVRLLATPIALVSLVDDHRQFFKSACGLPEPWASRRETPLSHSFCQHVVTTAAPLVVGDAREHPMVCNNRAVADLNVIAYLGIPLATPHGTVLGSFCVIDTQPRQWTDADQQTMTELATSVMSEVALRFAHDEAHRVNVKLHRESAKRETLLLELGRSEARLRAAQRLAGVGSFVLHNGCAKNGHWSEEARRILGIADSPPPTSAARFVEQLVHPEDRARVAAALERTMKWKQSCQIEYRSGQTNAGVRSLLTAIEPEHNSVDAQTALLTVLDITDRIKAEIDLAEYRSALWHVARVATAGEMAAVIAHELTQPLAAVSHTANACERLNAAGNIDRDELAVHLGAISAQTRRASGIIQQIRSYVRKQPPTQTWLSIDQVVDDILGMLAPLSKKLEIHVTRAGQKDLPPVQGDEIQLGQLVLNLVRNAFDAVVGNPVCERQVRITTSCADLQHIVLEVTDNGPGISGLRDHIFEPFFSTRKDGLGMGLPIARTIAEAHHAELTVMECEPHHPGAGFRVAFPIIAHHNE